MKCTKCGHEHTDHDYLTSDPHFQECRLCDCRRNLQTGSWSGFLEMADLANLGEMKDEL
jgi:hypothetical protein